MNGSSGSVGLAGRYPSASCQKVIMRGKSFTSITMDPICTLPFSMRPVTRLDGHKRCLCRDAERRSGLLAVAHTFTQRYEPLPLPHIEEVTSSLHRRFL